jgi:WD40 repeat protein
MKIQARKITSLAGHKDCIYALEQGIEEGSVLSSGGDGLVAIWDLKKPEIGKLVAQVPQSVYALKKIKEKNQLLVGQNTEGLHLIDLENIKELRSLKTTRTSIFDIQYDENRIYVAYADGTVHLLDLDKWTIQNSVRASDKSARSIAIQPQIGHLAVAYSDFAIRIFDLKTLHLLFQWQAHQNSVFSVVYSPDGRFLLSGGRDAHLKVWDVQDNYRLLQDIPAHLFAINHITFSPQGNWFATCSMDKSIKIWDTQHFKLLKVIDKARYAGHGTSVNKLVWTNYQDFLVSGSDDRTLSLWEITG